MKMLELLGYKEEDNVWLVPELYRRAAACFEQGEMWRDAAECWAKAGEVARAAELYERLGDLGEAGRLLLGAGRYGEAWEKYQVWLEAVAGRDEVGEVRARLGIAAGLLLEAEGRESAAERKRGEEEARGVYLAARRQVEEEEGREALMAGRCWEALGEYGVTVGRRDLTQVGYEMALRRYGERHNRERVRAARAYLEGAKGNRLLVADIERRLAEWGPEEEKQEWEVLREEIEGLGFREGMRDVQHFVAEERQMAAWERLAEMEGDPDQALVDEYLAGLAPEGMVYVAAGTFLMGTTEEEAEALVAELGEDERFIIEREVPQHEVKLGGYYIGRYPVTNGEYRAFIEAEGYQTRKYWTEEGWVGKEREGWTEPRYWRDERYNGPRQPVVGVSWYEAVAYCRWAGVRLPSEAEWEKAAGWDPVAKRKRRYPWGDEWEEGRRIWSPNSWPEVGGISLGGKNPYEVHDMAGLYVWCSTRWRAEEREVYKYPYDARDGREDLSGGDDVWRVVRGGGSRQDWARCAYCDGGDPWYGGNLIGFRLAAPRRDSGS